MSERAGRQALVGAAAAIVMIVAGALAASGVDAVEVVATFFVVPVFAVGLNRGRRLGLSAAAAAVLAYGALRWSDLGETGAVGVGVLVVARGFTYAVVAHVGVLSQGLLRLLVDDDASPASPRRPEPASAWASAAPAPARPRRTPPVDEPQPHALGPYRDQLDEPGGSAAYADEGDGVNGHGQATGYGNAGYGDAGYGEARYDDAGYGDTRYGEARYGEARNDDAGYGDTRYGDAGYGDAGYDEEAYGDDGAPDARRGAGDPADRDALDADGSYAGAPYAGEAYVDEPVGARPPGTAPGDGRPPPGQPEAVAAVDPETRLWTAQFLCDRLAGEQDRAANDGTPFSLVMLQVPDEPLAALPYRRQVTLLRDLGHQLVGGGLLDHLVHVPDQTQHWFAVVLPGADRETAQDLEQRLRTGIGGYLRSRGLRLEAVESASLTAPDDDPAMDAIWQSLIGRGDPRAAPAAR